MLDKLYLRFPERFWEADRDMLGISQPDKGGLAVWANMEATTGEPILMAFASGQSAIDNEALTDAQVVDKASLLDQGGRGGLRQVWSSCFVLACTAGQGD